MLISFFLDRNINISFRSMFVAWFMCHTCYAKYLKFCRLQLTVAESADFWLGPSELALGPSLHLDWYATLAMWNTWSFAACSWFSAKTADLRYQVWHKNQATVLDRHSLVMVSGLKTLVLGWPPGHPPAKLLARRCRASDTGYPSVIHFWNPQTHTFHMRYRLLPDQRLHILTINRQ